MTYGFDSYNQTIELETINPFRSSEGGDTKPMVLVNREVYGVDCYNQNITVGVSMTLRVKAADSDHIPCVIVKSGKEPVALESNQNHATITNNGVCPTLPASMGIGGGYIPMIVVADDTVQQSKE